MELRPCSSQRDAGSAKCTARQGRRGVFAHPRRPCESSRAGYGQVGRPSSVSLPVSRRSEVRRWVRCSGSAPTNPTPAHGVSYKRYSYDGALTHETEYDSAVGPAIFGKTSARPGTRRTQPAEWRQWCTTCAYHPYTDTRRHASRTATDMDDDGCDRPPGGPAPRLVTTPKHQRNHDYAHCRRGSRQRRAVLFVVHPAAPFREARSSRPPRP